MTTRLLLLPSLASFLLTGSVLAQGFPATSVQWGLPAGGEVYNGVNMGFWNTADFGNDTGSDGWSTLDMNGDGLPDLVITSQRNANGYMVEFSPASNSYWKVHLNTGSGFSTTATNWSLPAGGEVYNGVNMGFWSLSDFGNDTGSDGWTTMDMNGDARPDLVVMSQRNANGYMVEFSPASNSYWKVYLNTGSGFSTTSANWPVPAGGEVYNGVNMGFWSTSDFGNDTGSDGWTTMDMDGDARPDLVVMSQRNANGYMVEFSPTSNSYWKVYQNTGSGFSSTSTSWLVPAGGEVYNGVNMGFWSTADFGNDTGSDGWTTMDMNGDARPDLVLTSQRNANGYMMEFSPASNSYWKVYQNTGSGFSSTSANWPVPAGGEVYNGVNMGFWSTADFGNDTGSDGWTTMDINGDARPDLVLTSQRNANGYMVEFSPSNNSYWKAHLNTGSGFNTASTTWSVPAGGEVYNGVNMGFWSTADFGNDTGSDGWSVLDMNGDGFLDLVVMSQRNANGYMVEFSPNNNSYWKVYLQANTSDVAEQVREQGLLVFPNPAADRLHVVGDGPLGEVLLTDAVGRTVYSAREGSDRATLDIGGLPRGAYVLLVRGATGLRTTRVLLD